MTEEETLTGTRKADFTDIYRQTDPRAYYSTLAPLDYQIAQHARPVVQAALAASGKRTVLDVCCSYGINAALLRHEVTWAELAAHYAGLDGLEPIEVARADVRYLRARRLPRAPRVLGLDVSAQAIDYAEHVGLLERGYPENLEERDPSKGLVTGLRDVGLVLCTGGIGYIGARTFERLLAAARHPERLWVVAFVLRVFDYTEIAEVLARHGLVTERLPGSYPQRRFADPEEQSAAVRDVRRRGLDPAGKEAAGWFHADCFVSRPG
jgi:SAM-dependent methyltransferase